MAAYVDARWGRTVLKQVMRATDQSGLLGILGTDEPTFLADWRGWVRDR